MNYSQLEVRAKTKLQRAVGFAQQRGWRIIKKRCITTLTVRGKSVTCLCPIAALILMNASERVQKAELKKSRMDPDSAARRAAKILGVKPYAVHQFMGSFDNNPDDDTKQPKMSPEEEHLVGTLIDYAHFLRKELRPKAA